MQTRSESQPEQRGLASAFLTLARTRRSLRRYRDEPIPQALLERVLEAARWAPSAHNRQPWRFCIVTTAQQKRTLSERMGAKWRADLLADGADAEMVERRVAISHARMTTAGALVIASLSMGEMDVYPDEMRSRAEYVMTVQSVALACQNLLLAAHEGGLAACWMCAPLFAPELVRDTLALPADWEPQALITLGFPAKGHSAADKTKKRRPAAEWTVWR